MILIFYINSFNMINIVIISFHISLNWYFCRFSRRFLHETQENTTPVTVVKIKQSDPLDIIS